MGSRSFRESLTWPDIDGSDLEKVSEMLEAGVVPAVVYALECRRTGNMYVGSTGQRPDSRWGRELYDLDAALQGRGHRCDNGRLRPAQPLIDIWRTHPGSLLPYQVLWAGPAKSRFAVERRVWEELAGDGGRVFPQHPPVANRGSGSEDAESVARRLRGWAKWLQTYRRRRSDRPS
jgi:hypothetical protein